MKSEAQTPKYPSTGRRKPARLHRCRPMLFALAALCLSAAVLMASSPAVAGVSSPGGSAEPLQPAPTNEPLRIDGLRRELAMLAVLAGGLSIAGACWAVQRLRRALTQLQAAAGRIAEGHLDTDAAVGSVREIAAIGDTINAIAANQQEFMLHVWNQTHHSLNLLDGICRKLPEQGNGDLKAGLQRLRRNIQSLHVLGEDAEFYGIRMEKGRLLSATGLATGSGKKPPEGEIRN